MFVQWTGNFITPKIELARENVYQQLTIKLVGK